MPALERYFGGKSLTAALVRIGTNVLARVFAGEALCVWTAGWLHAGFGYALANS